MKKKILYTIVALAATFATTSCENWLEATSSTSLPADKVFESPEGFSEALVGVYLNLQDNEVYGMNLTWYTAELIAYPYNTSVTAGIKLYQDHQYQTQSLRNALKTIWRRAYNIIANINMALEYVEKNKDVFRSEEEYQLYKGEFLGLRSYIYLDLIRLFGHVDMSEENMGKKAIPYAVKFDKEPAPQLSYRETFDMLIADIDTAIECLEAADPVAGNIDERILESFNNDGFWTKRNTRFNYAAALGLKARTLQWLNRLEEASQCAQKSIDIAFSSGLIRWANIEEIMSEGHDKDFLFMPEQIFGLSFLALPDMAAVTIPAMTNPGYIIPESFVDNTLFVRIDPETGSMSGAEDVRGPSLMLNYSNTGYWCGKLTEKRTNTSIPMMKVSELYYIIAENFIEKGQNLEAIKTIDMVRTHRGISENLPESANAADELMKEYYREFILEGKLVYWLKHKNVKESLCPSFNVKAEDLTFPFPQEEIDYGRVQE